jgi:hypothetical protein
MSHGTACLPDVHLPSRRLDDSFAIIFHDTADGFFGESIVYQSDPYEVVHGVKISVMLLLTFAASLWKQFTSTCEFEHGTNVECLLVCIALSVILLRTLTCRSNSLGLILRPCSDSNLTHTVMPAILESSCSTCLESVVSCTLPLLFP